MSLAACAASAPADDPTVVRADRPLDLVLARADGTGNLSTSEFAGRAALLVTFTMDNLPSQAVLRAADDLARAHPDDLVVIAIAGDRLAPDEHRQLLDSYVHALALAHTTFVLADDAVRDGVSPLGTIERLPTTFLVNRAGRLARRIVGYVNAQRLARLVAPALPAPRP